MTDVDALAIAPLLENPPPRSVAEVLNQLRFTRDELGSIQAERTEVALRLTVIHQLYERLGGDAIEIGLLVKRLEDELLAAVSAEVEAARERKAQLRV